MTGQSNDVDVLQETAETIRRLGSCTSGEALGDLLMAFSDSGRGLRLARLQGALDSENTRLAIRLLDEYLHRNRSHEEWLALGELAQRVALPEEKFSWQTR
ncbi:hypothetical protein [Thiobacillus sp.]|uniref:hypothetical protein n=1 Tax=Thiobacillus sp. TaxID=924 RepID=UPI0011D6BDDB|nr:hypothetical protein [Thiobacillus sp.]TXH76817.1 MAG: hypothetical protein E6Q82_01650 [Thiobacillus sp.]